jgi:hypothetical protein
VRRAHLLVVQPAVAVGVELEQGLRRVLDLLGVEFLIVIRVERFPQRIGGRPKIARATRSSGKVTRSSGRATRSAGKVTRPSGRATREVTRRARPLRWLAERRRHQCQRDDGHSDDASDSHHS